MKTSLNHRVGQSDVSIPSPSAPGTGSEVAVTPGPAGAVDGAGSGPTHAPAAVEPPERCAGALPDRPGKRRLGAYANEQTVEGSPANIQGVSCWAGITPPRWREAADRFIVGQAAPTPPQPSAPGQENVTQNTCQNIDSRSLQQQMASWREAMRRFDELQLPQPVQAPEMHHSRSGTARTHHAPENACRLISALKYVGPPALRDETWKHLAQSQSSTPAGATASAVIALIDNVTLLPDPALHCDRLAILTPAIINLPPSARSEAIDHLIHTVRNVAAGESRATTVEQIMLLLSHEEEPARAAHLKSLIELIQHCTAQDDVPRLLQTVVETARRLRGDLQSEVLLWIPRQFRTWQNRQLLKPAVLVLGRNTQVAGMSIQTLVSKAIATGLLDVIRDIHEGLRNDPLSAATGQAFAECLRAAVVVAGPAHEQVGEIMTALVEHGSANGYACRQQMLEAHCAHMTPDRHQALLHRLGLPS